jgi:hypothetical protein
MSLLVNNTLANPTASFYAAYGSGGGGGGGSNLTSPAFVLPGTDSNSELGLVAPTGGNTASLTIDANGGTSEILMNAGAAPAAGYEIKTDSFSGNFIIGGLVATLPLVSLNATSHTVALGDGAGSSLVSATAATISLDASLVGTVPAGGILTANSTGVSMTASTNPGVVVTSAQTTVQGNYKVNSTLGNTGSGGLITAGIPYQPTPPTQTGLYAIMARTVGAPTPTAGKICVGTIGYYLAGTGWVSGGNATSAPLVAAGEYAQFTVDNSVLSFTYSSVTQGTVTGTSVEFVQLTGNLNL